MSTQIFLLPLYVKEMKKLQLYFRIGCSKKFHAKILIVRHFTIISMFKNRAWLQQFQISIESFKLNMLYKNTVKKQHVNEPLSSMSNSYNICKYYLLHLIQVCKSETIIQNPWYKAFDEVTIWNYILFSVYYIL